MFDMFKLKRHHAIELQDGYNKFTGKNANTSINNF